MGMQVNIEITIDEVENQMNIDLSGEEMGILIGKRGITLDSLQYLVSLVINRNTEDYMKVKLDTENYRERRKETLENLAHNLAHKVKRIHRPVYLEPMNPYERRVIHSALQKDKYVETHSEGDEPYRKVVITLKPGVDTGYERRGKYSYGNSRYGKRNNGGYRKNIIILIRRNMMSMRKILLKMFRIMNNSIRNRGKGLVWLLSFSIEIVLNNVKVDLDLHIL